MKKSLSGSLTLLILLLIGLSFLSSIVFAQDLNQDLKVEQTVDTVLPKSSHRQRPLSEIFSDIDEPKIDKSLEWKNNALNLGILGGVGAGVAGVAKLGIDYWKRPQRLLKPIEQELSIMTQGIPSMKGMQYQDIPGRISREIAQRGSQLKDFDDLTLSTSAENLAESVKSAYPKLRQTNFQAYGEVIKAGENSIAKSGKSLNTSQFDSDVIDATIKELKNSIPQEELSKIKPMIRGRAAEKSIKFEGKNYPMITGKEVEKGISLRQAKKYLGAMKKKAPAEIQRTLDKNWGSFLEKNAPPDVAKELSKANLKYKDFTAQDKALQKFIDPGTGDYDYNKLYDHILKRAKTRINSDFKKLMAALSEVEPEIGAKAQNLFTLRSKRIEMQRGLNSLRSWLTKATELVSKRQELFERHYIRLRGAGKLLGSAAQTAGRAMIFKGIPKLGVAVGLGALDPTSQVLRSEFGTGNIGEIIEAIRTKKVPPSMQKEFEEWKERNKEAIKREPALLEWKRGRAI